ncbi:MAG: GerMN domain-containing protein [Firmicutes bacterium]|nr:GerMN domain-containing protein [Bacillota bacterium]
MLTKAAQRLAVLLLLGAIALLGVMGERWQPAVDSVLNPRVAVQLYFADSDALYLVPEVRWMPARDVDPVSVLVELGRGPASPELAPTIPRGARPRSVTVRGGVAWVDYTAELRERHSGGSTGEILTVYSIVSTLVQFPEIEAVQILLEGQPVETLVGHLDLSRPLTPDSRFLKEP